MGLHWVEQAALEAQAEIAAAAAVDHRQPEQQQRARDSHSHKKRRRCGEPEHFEAADQVLEDGCERHWSHSDELDQLVRLIRRPHTAAADEAYQTDMRQQLTAELQQIRVQLTQAAGWETRNAIPMVPRDSQWRRCAHEIAASFGLTTSSEGDGHKRRVVVSRLNRGDARSGASESPNGASSSTSSTNGGIGTLLRQQFDKGLLCWGRCIDYRCIQRRHGNTLLMECARAGATSALQALLTPSTIPSPTNSVVSVNICSLEGYTALHYASYCGHTAAVHALLAAGADVDARNVKGETAEGAARAGGHEHVAQVVVAWRHTRQCAQADVEPNQEGMPVSVDGYDDFEEGEVRDEAPAVEAVVPEIDSAAPQEDNWLRQLRPAATHLQVVSSAAKGVSAGLVVRLSSGTEKVVGRSRSQPIVLRDLEVSTAHATIGLGVGGAGLWVSDVGSNNGTFVNGERLSGRKVASQRRALFAGDQLQIGTTVLKAMASAPPPPRSSMASSGSTSDHGAREKSVMDASISAAASFAVNPNLGKHTLALEASDIMRERKCQGLMKRKKEDKYGASRPKGQVESQKHTWCSAHASASTALAAPTMSAKQVGCDSDAAAGSPVGEHAGIGGVGQEMLEKMGWKRGAGLGKNETAPTPVLERRPSGTADRLGVGAARPITDQLGLRPGAGLAGGSGVDGFVGASSKRERREQRRVESLKLTRARFDALDDANGA